MKADVGDVSHVQGTRETCRPRNSRFRSRSVLKQFKRPKKGDGLRILFVYLFYLSLPLFLTSSEVRVG